MASSDAIFDNSEWVFESSFWLEFVFIDIHAWEDRILFLEMLISTTLCIPDTDVKCYRDWGWVYKLWIKI